jgi:hypothetical protein
LRNPIITAFFDPVLRATGLMKTCGAPRCKEKRNDY